MSKETAFQIISIAVILIITAFYAGQYYTRVDVSKLSNSQPSLSGTGSQNATGTQNSLLTLTAPVVASHNSASNCWIVVQNKVYDVTSFLGQHSGGASQIIPFCGTDATQAFLTKAGTGTHRTNDIQFLTPLYLGDLNAQITTIGNSSNLNSPSNNNINRWFREDD